MSTNNSNCIFCKIINKDIPSEIIHEDNNCIVIPDKFPAMKGQCLVISKEHIGYAFDLDETTYNHLFSIAKKTVKAIDKALNPKRTCLVVEGFEIPHTHIKLFPTYGTGLKIQGGKEATNEEIKELASKVKENLDI
jgi:histidine triad (HIT) family protein